MRAVSLPPRSALAWRFMARYFERFLRRRLSGLWVAQWGQPPPADRPSPIVVYCNHPSWWDAALLILLAESLFAGRTGYAPFDARMLERYGIFRRLGAFPVALDTPRGAAQFLATSRAVLAAEGMLWITAQGRFADVRERPLGLKAGIARLPEIAPEALFLPLALEYAFWDESGAEGFCAFGAPLTGAELLGLGREARLHLLEQALTDTLDALSRDVIARDPARFIPLLRGVKGVGGIYDGWQLLRALLRGRRFDPAHGGRPHVEKGDAAESGGAQP